MSSHLNLDEVDVDGAIRETAHEASEALDRDGDTRLDFFKKAGLGPLIGSTGALDQLHPTDGLGRLGRVDPPPDLAINLHGSGPDSIDDLVATGARQNPRFTRMATKLVAEPGPMRHGRQSQARQISAALGEPDVEQVACSPGHGGFRIDEAGQRFVEHHRHIELRAKLPERGDFRVRDRLLDATDAKGP